MAMKWTEGYGVYAMGCAYPQAIFQDKEQAVEYGREHFPYNYIIASRKMPLQPMFTKKQVERAKREGAKLAALFREAAENNND